MKIRFVVETVTGSLYELDYEEATDKDIERFRFFILEEIKDLKYFKLTNNEDITYLNPNHIVGITIEREK